MRTNMIKGGECDELFLLLWRVQKKPTQLGECVLTASSFYCILELSTHHHYYVLCIHKDLLLDGCVLQTGIITRGSLFNIYRLVNESDAKEGDQETGPCDQTWLCALKLE